MNWVQHASAQSLGLALVAVVAFGYSLVQIARSLRAMKWPTVDGFVRRTRVVRRVDSEGVTDTDYIVYGYQVEGRPFVNDRIAFGLAPTPTSIRPGVDPSPNAGTTDLARRYPKDSPVRVHYNPKDPTDSVLYPRPAGSVWIALLIGTLALIVDVMQNVR